MSNVPRFSLVVNSPGRWESDHLAREPNGNLVRFEDYERLRLEINQLYDHLHEVHGCQCDLHFTHSAEAKS